MFFSNVIRVYIDYMHIFIHSSYICMYTHTQCRKTLKDKEYIENLENF